jgi:hypothetical protein
MQGLPVRSRSAEDYGTLLTAELERAMVLGESVLAICVDKSKAYDSVRLDLLEFLLEGSGMPKQFGSHWRTWPELPGGSRSCRRSASGGSHLRVHTRLPGGDLHHGPAPRKVAAGSAQLQPAGGRQVLGRRQHRLGQGPGSVGQCHPRL